MILSKLTYRKKCLLLISGMSLLLILTYLLSIRKTIEVTREISLINNRIQKAEHAPSQIDSLQATIARWDRNLLTEVDGNEIQLRIFDEISDATVEHKVSLTGIKRIYTKKEKDISIDTYEIIFCGDFKLLVQTLNYLEHNMRYGYITSTAFELVKNRKKRINELRLQLIVQSMIKN